MSIITIEDQLIKASQKLESLRHWDKCIKKLERIKLKRELTPKEQKQLKVCQQYFIDDANEGIR